MLLTIYLKTAIVNFFLVVSTEKREKKKGIIINKMKSLLKNRRTGAITEELIWRVLQFHMHQWNHIFIFN